MSRSLIPDPPSPAKQALIAAFLRLSGLQAEIDNASFLDRYAGDLLQALIADPPEGVTYTETIGLPKQLLLAAYEKHRPVWQEEFETHVNGTFSEADLAEIVAFLESAAGRLFIEDDWRMRAYIATNTEPEVEQILAEAHAALAARMRRP